MMTRLVAVLRAVTCLLTAVGVVLVVLATTPALQLEGLTVPAVVVTVMAGVSCPSTRR